MQRVARDLPILLALSASSPYWNEQDTGYASIRSIIWQRWPSAGATGRLRSAAEYDQLLADLINTGVIADAKMAYFDVRPSAHAPTLELRTCDACPIVDDAILIAGLFRASVLAAEHDIASGRALRSGAAAGAPGGDLAGRARRVVRSSARRHPAPQAAARERGGPDRCSSGSGPSWRSSATGPRSRSWPRRRWRAATRPTGSGPPTPNGAGSATSSSWWSPRRTVRPGAPRRPSTRPCGATGSGPATRRSARAVGPGRCIEISSSTTAAPARPGTQRPHPGPQGLGGADRADLRGRGPEAALLGRPGAAADQPARMAAPGARDSSSGRGRSRRSWPTSTASNGSWPRASSAASTSRVPPAGARKRPGCHRARSGRRSWASTWCATSSAAGGCSRTTCATRAVRRTRSRSGT